MAAPRAYTYRCPSLRRTEECKEKSGGVKKLEARVFVVIDNYSVQASLANLFVKANYSVEVFASAAE